VTFAWDSIIIPTNLMELKLLKQIDISCPESVGFLLEGGVSLRKLKRYVLFVNLELI